MSENKSDDFVDLDKKDTDEGFFQPPNEKETTAETARKSGLALSAGITLFGSVVALMIVGYLVDKYFGSSPKGLIGGIVLGSIIGFVQFFRLTSQILKK